MRINPVTITISDHHLVEALNALERVLAGLAPSGATYNRFDHAHDALMDARLAYFKRTREIEADRRDEAIRLQDMEGTGGLG